MISTLKVLQQCSAKATGCGWPEFILFLNELVQFGIFIAVTFATLTFAYAGFLMMTAGGNSGNVTNAKSIMGNAVLGIIWTLIAWLVVQFILSELGLGADYSLLT